MSGERLHDFDLDLCGYVLEQIRPHLRARHARPTSVSRLHPWEWEQLDLPSWTGRGIAGLPGPLADHVWAPVTGDSVELPLNDTELFALAGSVDDPPLRLAGRCAWEPFPALHR